jgi:hypothetical protein
VINAPGGLYNPALPVVRSPGVTTGDVRLTDTNAAAQAGVRGTPGRRACQSEPLAASERARGARALRTGDDARDRPTATPRKRPS